MRFAARTIPHRVLASCVDHRPSPMLPPLFAAVPTTPRHPPRGAIGGTYIGTRRLGLAENDLKSVAVFSGLAPMIALAAAQPRRPRYSGSSCRQRRSTACLGLRVLAGSRSACPRSSRFRRRTESDLPHSPRFSGWHGCVRVGVARTSGLCGRNGPVRPAHFWMRDGPLFEEAGSVSVCWRDPHLGGLHVLGGAHGCLVLIRQARHAVMSSFARPTAETALAEEGVVARHGSPTMSILVAMNLARTRDWRQVDMAITNHRVLSLRPSCYSSSDRRHARSRWS
jgi:hypothetical protein